jgi:hypothetical protein
MLINTSITVDPTSKILREGKHLCMGNLLLREREKCVDACKIAVRNSMVPVQQIFEEKTTKLKEDGCSILAVPEYSSVKSSLYRARYRHLRIPKARFDKIEEVEVPEYLGKDFVIVHDGMKEKIIIFSTPLAQTTLNEVNEFYSDGTFQITPRPFYQVYSLHVNLSDNNKENQFIPLVYALLPNKTQNTYTRLYTILKEKLSLNIDTFKCDFEVANINAVKQVFPEAKISGCFYHFQKAVRDKADNLGLESSQGKKIVRLCCMLAHLPSQFIPEAYLSINEEMPDSDTYRKFDKYFSDFWLNKITTNLISCYKENVRTTNSIEGWHHRINTRIPKHPSILLFVDLLKKEAHFQDFRLRKSLLHCPGKKRSKIVLDINDQIEKIVADFTDGKIEVLTCLQR